MVTATAIIIIIIITWPVHHQLFQPLDAEVGAVVGVEDGRQTEVGQHPLLQHGDEVLQRTGLQWEENADPAAMVHEVADAGERAVRLVRLVNDVNLKRRPPQKCIHHMLKACWWWKWAVDILGKFCSATGQLF